MIRFLFLFLLNFKFVSFNIDRAEENMSCHGFTSYWLIIVVMSCPRSL